MTSLYTHVAEYRGYTARSPQEQWLPDGHFRATVVYQCDWNLRNMVIGTLASGGGQPYPYNPATGARAFAANVNGIGRCEKVGGLNTYPRALITCHYSTRVPQLLGGAFIVESLEGRVSAKRLDASKFYWNNAHTEPLDSGEAPVMVSPGLVYQIQYWYVTSIPTTALTLVGSCNGSAVACVTLGITFGAETLLYAHPGMRRRMQIGTTNKWLLTYRFWFKPSGWNTFWRPEIGNWVPIYYEGVSTRYIQYPLGSFSALSP